MAVAPPPATHPSEARAPRRLAWRRPESSGLVGVGLLAVLTYAVFAHGATDLPAETRVQVALAAVALGACATGLVGGRISIHTDRTGWASIGLLAAFALWCAATLLWSVSPAATWLEVNRALTYVIALALGFALGSRSTDTYNRVALGWLMIAVAVALFAVGGKVAPSLQVPGLLDLNHTAVFSRLRAPLGYWNALALICALAVPIAVRTVTDTTRGRRVRLAALSALSLLLTVTGLTYSRGGVLALVVGVASVTLLGGPRLRGLLVVGLAAVSAVPALAVAFTSHTLTTNGVSLSERSFAGVLVALALLAGQAALLAGAWRLAALEQRSWPAELGPRVWRALAAVAAGLVLVGVLALAVSSRGLIGSIDDQISSFTSVRKDPITDPSRLLSTSSGNRWVWWKEAAGAFSDRPLGGWGAGSFPVTHLLYRKPPPLPVSQPHSMPLQFLAETGIVGAILALGAILGLIVAGVRRVRWMVPGRRRELSGAMLAAGLVWAIHGLFDWDWDIPGVTLPALVMLGLVAGRRDPAPAPLRPAEPKPPGPRILALAVLSVLLCAFAVSAILPAWAHTKAVDALNTAASASGPAGLQEAAAQADLASRLNPLSDEGLLEAATIAARRGLSVDARNYLVRAVRRSPYHATAWEALAFSALEAGDRVGAYRADQRALSLDPINQVSLAAAQLLLGAQVGPGLSATATGTPLGPSASPLPAAGPTPLPAAPR